MKKFFLYVLAGALWLAAVCCAAGYFLSGAALPVSLKPAAGVLLLCAACALLYLGALAAGSASGRRRELVRAVIWCAFALYIALLLRFTLFDGFFGRTGGALPVWSRETFRRYAEDSLNLLPLRTVAECVGAALGGGGLYWGLTNIVGNLGAFLPMGLFLPLLSRRCRRILPFICAAAGVSLFIELAQLALLTGACDVDDLILNVIGALLGWLLMRIRPVRRLIGRLTLIEL